MFVAWHLSLIAEVASESLKINKYSIFNPPNKVFVLSQVAWRSPGGLHWHICVYQTAVQLVEKRADC